MLTSSLAEPRREPRVRGTSIPPASVVAQRRREVVSEIVSRGLLTDSEPLCAVIDLDTMTELISSLKGAYPSGPTLLHTVAAKAIALRPILRFIAGQGLGCEVASPGELHLALEAGFPVDRIIYDSPAKTSSEIRQAIRLGVSFNIDNFEELERVDAIIREWEGSVPVIGVRINPQSGAGTIEAMSTGTTTSKFGIGLRDPGVRERLIEAFATRPWLRQLHTHSGSQGVPLEHIAADVVSVVELAESIERAAGEQRVDVIDVGGGLSVNFESDSIDPVFADHAAALHDAAPELFSGKYRIVTEFGRSLTAKCGVLIGRVEYVKETGGRRIAITPIGVQVATRTVFMPHAWPLRVEVFHPDGRPAEGPARSYDVVGPACFAGDVIASERLLPEIAAGDIVAVPDTGGYYASTHFSYNSLLRPAIYAITTASATAPASATGPELATGATASRTLHLVRRAQTLEELAAESGETELHNL